MLLTSNAGTRRLLSSYRALMLVVAPRGNRLPEMDGAVKRLDYEVEIEYACSLADAVAARRAQAPDLILIVGDNLNRDEVVTFCQDVNGAGADSPIPIIFMARGLKKSDRLQLLRDVTVVLDRPVAALEMEVEVERCLEHSLMLKEMAGVEQVLLSFVLALEARDSYTAGHARRVALLCQSLACLMETTAATSRRLYVAALLHDIGKIGVSDRVLNKSTSLSPQEMAQVQGHPDIAVDILRHLPGMRFVVDIIRHHHERWDGAGYPGGLSGPQTSQEARVLAVADALDAMLSDRPYRKALHPGNVRDILTSGRGQQWDPHIVDGVLAGNLIDLAARLCGGSNRESSSQPGDGNARVTPL